MLFDEIVLPSTEPETEWVRGRSLQKMSPTRNHSPLQLKIAFALDAWATGRGEVGPEWRFRLAVPGEPRRPLVPAVAFVSEERLRGETLEAIQAPEFAPTVAVEVLSPRDDRRDVASTIDVYLRAGTELVIVIDPTARTVALHDRRAVRGCRRATFSVTTLCPNSHSHSARISLLRSIGASVAL